MNDKPKKTLRLRAEEQLQKTRARAGGNDRPVEELLHELQIHQIELVMQNEELRRSRLALEASREKYVDLYDHAPIGYLLVDDRGMIVKANLTFCSMVGTARFKLIGKPLSQWIGKEFQDQYFLFRQQAPEAGQDATVDLQMCRRDGSLFFARIQGFSEDAVDGAGSGLRLAVSDISDRYETQVLREDLKQSGQQLASALDAAGGGLWRWDAANNAMWFDERATRITGQENSVLEKDFTSLTAIIHYDDFGRVEAVIDSLFRGANTRFQEKFRIKRTDGGWMWLNVLGRVIERDDQGRPNIITGILFDVDKQIKLQQELAESRHWLKEIVDNLPACIAYVDRDLRYRFNNRRYQNIFGLSPEACRGRKVNDVLSEEAFLTCLPHFRTVLAGSNVTFVNSTRTADGTLHTFRISFLPDFDREQVKGFFVLAIDITDLEQTQRELDESRHRLHQIVDNLPACIAYVDRDQRYLFNNRCFEKWFGITPEQCRGKTVREIIGKDGYLNNQAHVQTVLAGHPISFESTLTLQDRMKHILEVTYVPDFDRDGQVKGYIVLAIDISDTRRVQQLREAMAGLEEKSTALQDANIALKVLIDQQQNSRVEIEQQVLVKLKKLVFPYLDLLKGPIDDEAKKEECLAIIRAHLGAVADSFIQKLDNPVLNLSPREILVADLVRQGRSTREMADLLALSVRTVEAYRMQLRKKLGLQTKKENLRTYLLQIFGSE